MRKTAFTLLASASLLLARTVHADDSPPADTPRSDDARARYAIDRTWLYADDARVALPMTVVATSSVSYTSVGNDPARIVDPFPGCPAPCSTYNSLAGNTATPGGMFGVGGELGLLPRLSVMTVAQVGSGGTGGSSPTAGVIAGLRLQVLPPEWRELHLVVSGGYLREAWQGPVHDDRTDTWHGGSPNGDNGAWVQASISGDVARLRMVATLHGEHVFSDGRDPLDVMVQAGASYRLAGDFRAGVEYVGQDLEESLAAGAEGVARQFLGPVASLQLLGRRLSMVAGPAIGLTSRSPDLLGRLAVSYAF